ncbi:DNA-binding protein [Bordetella bronchialis]|uniref:helix-turn-helix domain-containing transcriptional regulator n=1 Tax=Bordetella bronchialis TaxID=463025 RepID=UPI003CFE5C8B
MTAQQVQFSRFDAVDYLDSDEAIKAYLQVVSEESAPDLLAAALEDVTRARVRLSGLVLKRAGQN